MLRLRLAGILMTVCLLIGGPMGPRGAMAAPPVLADPGRGRAAVLELFYTPPVLVRSGERVLIPVDVVCATAEGRLCAATAGMAVRAQGDRWETVTAPAVKGLRFDVTAPADRALAAGGVSGRVDFYIRAGDRSGRTTTTLGSQAQPLSFYVTRSLPVVHVTGVPFGRVRRGRAVVALAWGSGPMHAGLEPGLESATLGPSSFDVDASGRVVLADAMQDRVAVFERGRLVRSTQLPVSARADIAAAADGGMFVADRRNGSVELTRIAPSGEAGETAGLGEGLSWQIRVMNGRPYVNMLPRDAWVSASSGGAVTGMPTGFGTRLIRLGTEASVRVGTVGPEGLVDAIEVRSDLSFGDVALAEPDGAGGYVVVVHTWRRDPRPADQYQVIHLREGRVIETFAVANTKFAETPPLSRFRVGQDGSLYHLSSTSSGITIERFPLKGKSR